MAKPVSIRASAGFAAGRLTLPRRQSIQLPPAESAGGFYLRSTRDFYFSAASNLDNDNSFYVPEDFLMPVSTKVLSEIWVWTSRNNQSLWWTTK